MTKAILPSLILKVLEDFTSAFSRMGFVRFVALILAAVLTTGSRTVSNLFRLLAHLTGGDASSYHKIFSKRRWSTWTVARCVAGLVLRHFVPEGVVHLCADDTVDQHPGDKVYGKGCHRDPTRSTRTFKAFRFGHKWVVLAIVVKLPFSKRHWALPVHAALARSARWDKKHKKTHYTPPETLEGMVQALLTWFPERKFRLSVDGQYATHRLAHFCHRHQKQLTLVTHLRSDAALYEPLTAADRKKGRPRLKGKKLPCPREVVRETKQRRSVTVSWYGGAKRQVEIVTRKAIWYRDGLGAVPIIWVFVHDLTGTHRDEYFFSTDWQMSPQMVIAAYTERWSIEVTFEEARSYLGLGTTRFRARRSVLREGPFLFWLYSLVVTLFVHLPKGQRHRVFIAWKGKQTLAFSDVITGLRRWLWLRWIFPTLDPGKSAGKIPRALREVLLVGLAPAA